MRKTRKKLQLGKETLRAISGKEATAVVGGIALNAARANDSNQRPNGTDYTAPAWL